jgi:VCBS repeat-containing protein
MCTPSASSLLMLDHNYFVENNLMDRVSKSVERWTDSKLGSFKLKTNKQWQWIIDNTDKFEVLRLSGGEPFYNSSVLEFIDKAIAEGTAKNITLEFHTNATLFDSELIEKLSHFQNNLNFSIDGYGKVYEFIRYPATWTQLDNSVRSYMAKIPQRFYNIANIMMISNVFNLPEFIAWLDSLPGEMSVSYAEVHSQTRGMSLINLSTELLEQAHAEVKAAGLAHPRIMVDNALNIIQDSINNNVGDKNKALEELRMFDMSRNQNYKDYLDPRITKWLES